MLSQQLFKKTITAGRSLIIFLMLCSASLFGQAVTPWLTQGDQNVLLSEQANISFGSTTNSTNATITIDNNVTYQSIAGFGFMLTQGSAESIRSLNDTQKDVLLNELFGSSGLDISAIRISIGASDLSNSVYSYNETPGDVNMNNFSLAGPDLEHLIPVIKDILAIKPDIKILATPWSAPSWMKTNNSFIGGSLQSQYYAAYARYFVEYLEAMQSEGISIWAITPQNEPENPFNEPSMLMNANEQVDFINNHLGPQIIGAGFNPKIIAFDHNCDNTSYPTQVLNNSSYVDGAAFHLYAGSPSAMSTVRNNTGKNIYFTEQFTGIDGSFSGDLGWHMRNVVTGSLNNWSRTVFEWNLAAYPDGTPRTPGGCSECLPAVTIDNSNSYTRNVAYYIIGQVVKFVQPGALRIQSSSNNSNLYVAALRNPDNQLVVLAYNDESSTLSVRLVADNKAFDYAIPPKSAVTFVWTPDNSTPPGGNVQSPFNEVIPIPGIVEAENFDEGDEGLAYNDSDDGNNGGQLRNTNVDLENTSEGGYNVGWTADGEWLKYTVNVANSGLYDLVFRVASTGNSGQVSVAFDGVDKTGVVSLPSTGGFQHWQDVVVNDLALIAGEQVMRINILVGGFNLNRLTFSSTSILPVTLSSWSATPLDKSVLLRWETTAEAQSDFFRLERSADGTRFREIARVPASGRADRYAHTDEDLIPGNYFYRLTQVDLDGREQQFSIQQIALLNGRTGWPTISPNPAAGDILVHIPELQKRGKVSVSIYATDGNQVFRQEASLDAGPQHLPLTLLELPAGLYYAVINYGKKSFTLPLSIL